MRDYDEFDEERDLKKIKTKSDINEFGDRITKSDILNGCMFWAGLAVISSCLFVRGCQEIKKHAHNDKPSVSHSVRFSPHQCR